MKRTFATFEHSTLGFPLVVLKWTEENGRITNSYVTVKGIIEGPWGFQNPHPECAIDYECDRFDAHVRQRFHNDASVQG